MLQANIRGVSLPSPISKAVLAWTKIYLRQALRWLAFLKCCFGESDWAFDSPKDHLRRTKSPMAHLRSSTTLPSNRQLSGLSKVQPTESPRLTIRRSGRQTQGRFCTPRFLYPGAATRHLVIACHTLLLNIYLAVLTALRHDAALQKPSLSLESCTSLANIHPVFVMQLCSYLIERQRQAVDLYLSVKSPLPQSQQLDDPRPQQSNTPVTPVTTNGDRGVIYHLEREVKQRLAQLRQTLCI